MLSHGSSISNGIMDEWENSLCPYHPHYDLQNAFISCEGVDKKWKSVGLDY